MHSNFDDPVTVSMRVVLEAFTAEIEALQDQGLGQDEWTDRLRACALAVEADIDKRCREACEAPRPAGHLTLVRP